MKRTSSGLFAHLPDEFVLVQSGLLGSGLLLILVSMWMTTTPIVPYVLTDILMFQASIFLCYWLAWLSLQSRQWWAWGVLSGLNLIAACVFWEWFCIHNHIERASGMVDCSFIPILPGGSILVNAAAFYWSWIICSAPFLGLVQIGLKKFKKLDPSLNS